MEYLEENMLVCWVEASALQLERGGCGFWEDDATVIAVRGCCSGMLKAAMIARLKQSIEHCCRYIEGYIYYLVYLGRTIVFVSSSFLISAMTPAPHGADDVTLFWAAAERSPSHVQYCESTF